MARVAWILVAGCVLGACSSEENNEPGLLDRLGEAMTHDQREEARRRRALEEERAKRRELEKQIELEKRSGLKVNLPSGASQDIDIRRASVVIILHANGDPIVSGTVVPMDKLDALFERAYELDNDTQVVFQVDKGVEHGKVVTMMEKAKAAGLTRLAIGTSSH